MNFSNLIKSFNRAAPTYNSHAFVQSLMAQQLLGKIRTSDFEHILELGCGSGNLTALLLDNFDKAQIDAIDLSDNMLKQCERLCRSDRLRLYCEDVNKYTPNKRYPLIVSNALLQWIDDKQSLFHKISSALQLHGQFIFTDFAPDNLLQLRELTGIGLDYLPTDQQSKLLKASGFDIELAVAQQAVSYSDPLAMLKDLKLMGLTGLSQKVWTRGQLKKLIDDYQTRYQNQNGVYLNWSYRLWTCSKTSS